MSDSDAGNPSPSVRLLRKFLKWFIGGISGIAATIITAHLTGLLDKLELGPDDSFCRFIQSPFLEKNYDGELPSIFVAAFSGRGGREAAQELADQIKFRTGLPTLTSCKTVPLSDGPDATRASVGKALDRGRSLASDRHAQIVIVGAMRGNDAADIAITNTLAETGDANAIRTRLILKETTDPTFPNINSLSDEYIIPALYIWSKALQDTVDRDPPPEMPFEIHKAALALSKLAEHEPPLKWLPLDQNREKISYTSWLTHRIFSRKYNNCAILLSALKQGTTFLKNRIPRNQPTNSIFEDIDLFLIFSKYYMICMDSKLQSDTIKYFHFEKATNFIDKISEIKFDKNFYSHIATYDPWPEHSSREAIESLAALAFSKSVLDDNFDKKEKYMDFSAKIFAGYLLYDRAHGMRTSTELARMTNCPDAVLGIIDNTRSWKLLEFMDIDPKDVLKYVPEFDNKECYLK